MPVPSAHDDDRRELNPDADRREFLRKCGRFAAVTPPRDGNAPSSRLDAH
jgi:hypothetical protein